MHALASESITLLATASTAALDITCSHVMHVAERLLKVTDYITSERGGALVSHDHSVSSNTATPVSSKLYKLRRIRLQSN